MDATSGLDDPRIPADLAPESKRIMAAMVCLGLLDGEPRRSPRSATGDRRSAGYRTGPIGRLDRVGDAGGSHHPGAARIYHRPGPATAGRSSGCTVAGWVLGDLDHADADCRRLCLDTASLVVSVDYRLAPRAPLSGLSKMPTRPWSVLSEGRISEPRA